MNKSKQMSNERNKIRLTKLQYFSEYNFLRDIEINQKIIFDEIQVIKQQLKKLGEGK